jgi:hypothetical protein
MSHNINQQEDWRDDHGLIRRTIYKKSFAIFPVICAKNQRIWLKTYYKKYITWSHSRVTKVFYDEDDYGHTDFIENVSEGEFLVRKLSETL